MTSVGIIANADKETIIEAINTLKNISGFKIIFIRQAKGKLYIVGDRVFSMEGNNEQ